MATPVFDLDQLIDRLGGDREATAEILQIFIEDTPARIEEIRNADTATAMRAAHTIKGSAGNIVAMAAFEAAAALEQALRSGDEAAASGARQRLFDETDRLMAALAQAQASLASEGSS